MSLVSYVIPVYNNSGSLHPTWEAIRTLFQGPLAGHSYEIIFVNDGSADASLAELHAICSDDPCVTALALTRNFGQLAAILAGYGCARGDAVINMSADLQDPPELTVDMVGQWQAGNDVVVAYRSDREDGMTASLMSRLAYAAVRSGNRNIPPGGFDFVLMSRPALDIFMSYKGRNRFYQGDVLWAGLKTSFIPYVRRQRMIGKSQYTFGKKVKLFFDFTIDSSYLPIRMMSLCGAMLAMSGIGYAAVIVVARLLGKAPFAGWAPIMVVMLVTSGMVMLMLGIVGEYIWRILDEVKDKPMYLIDNASSRNDRHPE